MSDRGSGNSRKLINNINLLLMAIGGGALGYSIIRAIIQNYTFKFCITHPSVNVVAIGLALLIAGHYLWPGALKYLHIAILTLTATLSILSDYNQFYGLGQVVLLVIILYKYGFLDRHIKRRLLIISLGFITAVEVSLLNSELSGIGLEVFMFMVYFVFFLYLIYKNEIDEIIADSDRVHSHDIARLEREKKRINKQLEKYKDRLRDLDKAIELEVKSEKEIDWDRFKLTKTERKIITILVSRNASNKQIAEELGVKERTVKTHLYNIYNKIGIGTRTELTGMFYSLNRKEKDRAPRE